MRPRSRRRRSDSDSGHLGGSAGLHPHLHRVHHRRTRHQRTTPRRRYPPPVHCQQQLPCVHTVGGVGVGLPLPGPGRRGQPRRCRGVRRYPSTAAANDLGLPPAPVQHHAHNHQRHATHGTGHARGQAPRGSTALSGGRHEASVCTRAGRRLHHGTRLTRRRRRRRRRRQCRRRRTRRRAGGWGGASRRRRRCRRRRRQPRGSEGGGRGAGCGAAGRRSHRAWENRGCWGR